MHHKVPHGIAHCFSMANCWVCVQLREGSCCEFDGGCQTDLPVWEQQSPRPGVEKSACQDRLDVSVFSTAIGRAARRECDPVGVELQSLDFIGRKQAVVPIQLPGGICRGFLLWGKDEARLGQSQRTMGGKIEDAIVGKVTCFG